MFATAEEVNTAADRRIDDLEQRIAQVCGHLNVGHGQLIDLIIETLATNGWHGHGFRSPEHWVALRTGLSPTRARHLVLLARRAARVAGHHRRGAVRATVDRPSRRRRPDRPGAQRP